MLPSPFRLRPFFFISFQLLLQLLQFLLQVLGSQFEPFGIADHFRAQMKSAFEKSQDLRVLGADQRMTASDADFTQRSRSCLARQELYVPNEAAVRLFVPGLFE